MEGGEKIVLDLKTHCLIKTVDPSKNNNSSNACTCTYFKEKHGTIINNPCDNMPLWKFNTVSNNVKIK